MKPAARRKRSPMSRLRPYWVVGIIVAGLAAWAAVACANAPAFHLKNLSVSGIARVSRADVVTAAALDPIANVWLLNSHTIEARIEAIPYVRSAKLHRRPIADVTIAVVERTPSACVRDGLGRTVTIDRDNRLLQNDCSDDSLVAYALRAPIDERAGDYVGASELGDLEADSATLIRGSTHFRAFSHDRFGQLVALMPSGIAIEFGEEGDLGRKERLIAPILAEVGTRSAAVKSVDLRAPATPIVEFRAPVIHRRPQPVHTQ